MPELTIVVPTLNERGNLQPLLRALETVLAGVDYEVMFVDDDSADDTPGAARALAQRDPRVRILHRIGRRGLASAAVEGMLASSAPYLAVIDGDLQHDESILPVMLAKLRQERLDIVIGTRHAAGGSQGEMASHRVALSRVGQLLSSAICRQKLTDPMSGYFVVTRDYLNEVVRSLSATGFKILLDLVASSRRPVRFGEVGYRFRPRLHGQSKLDILVSLEYLQLIADKLVGNWIPVTYVIFGCVGAVGVIAQLSLIELLRRVTRLTPESTQFVSSVVVIGLNFALNNQLTFRSHRLSGLRFLTGMAAFYLGCAMGLVLNIQVFTYLLRDSVPWYLAATAGIIVGSVWNYWMSVIFVWRMTHRRRRLKAAGL